MRRICGEGSFNLNKFICNRKEVLQYVPECHRRSWVKIIDLDGSFRPKRALETYSDTDFKFKINLDLWLYIPFR